MKDNPSMSEDAFYDKSIHFYINSMAVILAFLLNYFWLGFVTNHALVKSGPNLEI